MAWYQSSRYREYLGTQQTQERKRSSQTDHWRPHHQDVHAYYRHKQPYKDWNTKQLIETALRIHPSYGHKRLARHLGINKKRVLRVMKLYGIKPYRRTTPKIYTKPKDSVFPNLLMSETPCGQGDIYASDFTYIKYQGRWIYVATILDVYTREIVGVSILTTHNTQLVLNASFILTKGVSIQARIMQYPFKD